MAPGENPEPAAAGRGPAEQAVEPRSAAQGDPACQRTPLQSPFRGGQVTKYSGAQRRARWKRRSW